MTAGGLPVCEMYEVLERNVDLDRLTLLRFHPSSCWIDLEVRHFLLSRDVGPFMTPFVIAAGLEEQEKERILIQACPELHSRELLKRLGLLCPVCAASRAWAEYSNPETYLEGLLSLDAGLWDWFWQRAHDP